MITLGIESSCDETSIALLENQTIRYNAIYSQAEHSLYGGVVPEVASRAHLEKIDRLMQEALKSSSFECKDIDLIAVTDRPGLAGALLVGVSFALGLHTRWRTHITGVNHLEGHIFSVMIEYPELQFPFLALVVSGGHTAIYKVCDIGSYECLGQTVDDAAGEAFDKVGKLLGFPYPAGRAIQEEAAKAESKPPFTFPIARFSDGSIDFSFSGLKTSVKNFISGKDAQYIANNRPYICNAFQKAVIDSLCNNMVTASNITGIKSIVLVGGVACNTNLREELQARFDKNVYFPKPALCTDNAAMIALAGLKRSQKNLTRFPKMDPSKGL
jgi:N6-L-threonylcarbamoyladenine synthase